MIEKITCLIFVCARASALVSAQNVPIVMIEAIFGFCVHILRIRWQCMHIDRKKFSRAYVENYLFWKSCILSVPVLDYLNHLPKDEMVGLTSQIRRSAVSISPN